MRTSISTVVLIVCLLASLAGTARSQVLEPEGDEFQVSAPSPLYRVEPSVAMQDSGDFVIVWAADRESASGYDITGQRYASDGSAIGGEFIVNNENSGFEPQVATAPAGDFVVVWRGSNDPVDTIGNSVQARLYGADGQPRGTQFLVNAYTSGSQVSPAVVVDDQGAFTVVWSSGGSFGDDDSSSSIQLRRFDSAGTALGNEVQINSYTSSFQREPAILRSGDDFIVAWESAGSFGDDLDDTSIQARRLGSDGSFVGDQFQVNVSATGGQRDPAMAADDSGRFLVAWESRLSNFESDIRSRLYDSAGTALGDEIEVNSITTNRQRFPGVAAGPDGHFAVVWESDVSAGSDGSGTASVQLRTIASDGTPVASDLQVNTYTDSGQEVQTIASNGQGSFVVTWMSYGSDTSVDEEPSIQAQRFQLIEMAGRVWLDSDLDGLQDDGENGLEGVRVDLLDSSAMLVDSATTDGNGEYSIYPPASGEYTVAVEQILPYAFTPRDQGTDDTIDSDVDPSNGLSASFQLTGRSRIDAGQTNGLGDRVWLDHDGDGVQDASEPGVDGVGVSLVEEGVGEVAATTTDAEGRYLFSDLTPGIYQVKVAAPADFTFSAMDQGGDEALDSDIDPSSGETASFLFDNGTIDFDIDAGLEPAVIGNRVWLDDSANGLQDEGEQGLGGVTVRLLDAADAEIAATTTDGEGFYGFMGIASGDYRIEVVAPTDGVFSGRDVGSDDLIDSDVDPATGRTELFAYAAGSASRGWDAGLRLLPFFADGFESGTLSAWSASVP